MMTLIEHPVALVLLLLFAIVIVGMTYDFILRMFGKESPYDNNSKVSKRGDGKDEPPEAAFVPKPPTPPNDTLEGAEEIPSPDGIEDENPNVEYTYESNSPWWLGSKDWDSEPEEKETTKQKTNAASI